MTATRAALAVVAWTAVGLVFALPGLSAGRDSRSALLGSLAQWWSWGVVATLIVAIDRRLPLSDKQLARRILVHFLLSLPITALHVYVFAAVLALLGLEVWSVAFDPRTLLAALHGMFLWGWLVYWLIVGGWQAYQ